MSPAKIGMEIASLTIRKGVRGRGIGGGVCDIRDYWWGRAAYLVAITTPEPRSKVRIQRVRAILAYPVRYGGGNALGPTTGPIHDVNSPTRFIGEPRAV